MKYNIWPTIYYTIYRFNVFTQDLVNGIMMLLFNIPAITKLYEHRGITKPKETVKDAMKKCMSEINILLSDASIIILTIMLEIMIVNIISCFAHNMILSKNGIKAFFIIGGLAIAFNYITLWNNHKYKKYFIIINNNNKKDRRRTLAIGCISILTIMLFSILSFYMIHLL